VPSFLMRRGAQGIFITRDEGRKSSRLFSILNLRGEGVGTLFWERRFFFFAQKEEKPVPPFFLMVYECAKGFTAENISHKFQGRSGTERDRKTKKNPGNFFLGFQKKGGLPKGGFKAFLFKGFPSGFFSCTDVRGNKESAAGCGKS